MPFYEYQCKSCHHHLEVMQKMSDPVLTLCPQCQKSDLGRIISAPAFQLKGTGWYATDFKDKGKAPTESKEKTKEDKTAVTTSDKNHSTKETISTDSGKDEK